MHYQEIRDGLRNAGTPFTVIARRSGVSLMYVIQAAQGKVTRYSPVPHELRIQIATALNKELHEIWPALYEANTVT